MMGKERDKLIRRLGSMPVSDRNLLIEAANGADPGLAKVLAGGVFDADNIFKPREIEIKRLIV